MRIASSRVAVSAGGAVLNASSTRLVGSTQEYESSVQPQPLRPSPSSLPLSPDGGGARCEHVVQGPRRGPPDRRSRVPRVPRRSGSPVDRLGPRILRQDVVRGQARLEQRCPRGPERRPRWARLRKARPLRGRSHRRGTAPRPGRARTCLSVTGGIEPIIDTRGTGPSARFHAPVGLGSVHAAPCSRSGDRPLCETGGDAVRTRPHTRGSYGCDRGGVLCDLADTAPSPTPPRATGGYRPALPRSGPRVERHDRSSAWRRASRSRV